MHNNQPIAETSGLGNDVDLCEANAALIVKAVNEHAALKSFVESIAKMDADYADKAVLESMVATAKQLTQAT